MNRRYLQTITSGIYKEHIQLDIKKKTTKQKSLNLNWAEDLNRYFQRRHKDATRHMKRCSTSLITRKMQVKATLRLTPHTCQSIYYQRGSK